MSDENRSAEKKPIGLTQAESALWIAPLPDAQKPVAKDTKLCVYCDRYHGGVNKGRECLENGVRALREQLAAKDVEIQTFKNLARLERAGKPEPPAVSSNNSLELTGSAKPVEPEPEKK